VLRITRTSENGSPVTLKLEGKIHAEWVSLLQQECQTLVREKKDVLLDFAEVTYMDIQGIKLIRSLPARSIRIINAPAFIEELLDR